MGMGKLTSKEMASPVKYKNIIGSQIPNYRKTRKTSSPMTPQNNEKEDEKQSS